MSCQVRKVRISRRIEALLVVIAVVLIVLGCWVHWEAVKPLKSHAGAWGRDFPAPFYLWEAPIWFWHDLAYTLIVVGGIILGFEAVVGLIRRRCRHCD